MPRRGYRLVWLTDDGLHVLCWRGLAGYRRDFGGQLSNGRLWGKTLVAEWNKKTILSCRWQPPGHWENSTAAVTGSRSCCILNTADWLLHSIDSLSVFTSPWD